MCIRACLVGVLALSLAACGGFRDRSADYQKAESLAPMQLPEGSEARPLRELYPIPAARTVQKPEAKFKVPAPKPLPEQQVAEGLVPSEAGSTLSLGQDGNGYPTLQASGSFSQVWDKLDMALKAAGIKVDDRNQSLGLYYLQLAEAGARPESYQLRLSRGLNAYSLSLQKDDDTLASPGLTKTLFEKIQAKWPDARRP